MFIYISHYTLRGWWHRFGFFQHPLIDVFVGIAGGILLWRIWEMTTDRLLKGFARSTVNKKSELGPV